MAPVNESYDRMTADNVGSPCVDDNGCMQVYHMPGQSDNFVTAFRTWLQKHGGGGPWGPMDASWLQVTHHAPVSTPGRSSAVFLPFPLLCQLMLYTAPCRMLLSICYISRALG